MHVFIESLCNDIRERCSEIIQEDFVLYSPVVCPNTGEYGATKSVFPVVLRGVYAFGLRKVIILNILFNIRADNFFVEEQNSKIIIICKINTFENINNDNIFNAL